MDIKHLEHKHGGKITAIRAIGHNTYKGVSYWFYTGCVKWSDNSASPSVEILPSMVCFDSDKADACAEHDAMSERLTDYLKTNGEWSVKGDWKPKTKTGHADL